MNPKNTGVPLAHDPKTPLPYGRRNAGLLPQEQRNEFDMVNRLNRFAAVQYPEDTAVRARIKSYELAFRMQSAVPDAVNLARETKDVQQLYGLNSKTTRIAGRRLLTARRMVERKRLDIDMERSEIPLKPNHTGESVFASVRPES